MKFNINSTITVKFLALSFFVLITLPISSFGNEKLSWVDLPPDNLQEILHEYDHKFYKLNQLIQNYHKIEKTSWNKIDIRIQALRKIASYANHIKPTIKNRYLVNTATKYSKLATEKANYLQKLKELKEYKYQKIKHDIFDTSIIPKNYTPLLLNNERRLEFKTQEFWGQCFIEAVDPCHRRQLLSYHETWAKKCKKCPLLEFFIWLEDQNVSLFLPSINSLSKKDLEKFKVTIKNGEFYNQDHKLITTESFLSADKISKQVTFGKEPIFVIDADENFYLTYGSEKNAHVTLSNYLPLIGSGKIWLKKGIIEKISFESGHYLPRMAHFIQVIHFLEKKGMLLKDNIKITYYLIYQDYTNTLKNFKKTYMQHI